MRFLNVFAREAVDFYSSPLAKSVFYSVLPSLTSDFLHYRRYFRRLDNRREEACLFRKLFIQNCRLQFSKSEGHRAAFTPKTYSVFGEPRECAALLRTAKRGISEDFCVLRKNQP